MRKIDCCTFDSGERQVALYGETEEGQIMHVHCSVEPVWIVTVYAPTSMPEEWDDSLKGGELPNEMRCLSQCND